MSKVDSAMTRNVKVLDPKQTVGQAARAMRDMGVGSMPVCEGTKLVGLITEHDIVARVVATGKSPESLLVERLMSSDVCCVGRDEDLDDVLIEMSQNHARLMLVVDAQMHLVGMVSLSDLERSARKHDDAAWVSALIDRSELAPQRTRHVPKRKVHGQPAALVH